MSTKTTSTAAADQQFEDFVKDLGENGRIALYAILKRVQVGDGLDLLGRHTRGERVATAYVDIDSDEILIPRKNAKRPPRCLPMLSAD